MFLDDEPVHVYAESITPCQIVVIEEQILRDVV
jgi:hypothetical protein